MKKKILISYIFLFLIMVAVSSFYSQANILTSTTKSLIITSQPTIDNNLNFSRTGSKFQVSYLNKGFEIEAIAMRNNITYTWQQIKTAYPDSNFQIDSRKTSNSWKFDLNFTNGQGIAVNLPSGSQLMLNLTKVWNISLNDVKKTDDGFIFYNKIILKIPKICNMNINLQKRNIILNNLSAECLDPTIQLTSGNFTSYIHYNDVGVTTYGIQEKINIKEVPYAVTIDNVTICHNIQAGNLTDNDARVWYVNNQSWDMNLINATDIQVMTKLNQTDGTFSNWTDVGQWACFDVISQFKQARYNKNRNFTLRYEDTDNLMVDYYATSTNLFLGDANYMTLDNPVEATPPYINVSYTPLQANISFILPTLANASSTGTLPYPIRINYTDVDNPEKITFNWNGTNFTFHNNNTQLHYNFDNLSSLDESEIYIRDLSPYHRDADYGRIGTGSVAYFSTPAKYGKSIKLNSNWIDPESIIEGNTTNFTVSYWCRFTANNIRTCEIDHISNVWLVKKDTDNKFHYYWWDGAQYQEIQTGKVTPNKWYMITAVNNATERNLYLDGKLVATSAGGGLNFTGSDFRLHIVGAAGVNAFFDDVYFFNKSLSAEEISQLYMTDLRKIDESSWQMNINQMKNSTTQLDEGNYTYYSTITNEAGQENMTDNSKLRFITITKAPYFTNVTSNQTYAKAGQYVNFTSTVWDDQMVNNAWIEHNFNYAPNIISVLKTGSSWSALVGERFSQGIISPIDGYLGSICNYHYTGPGGSYSGPVNFYETDSYCPSGNVIFSTTFSSNQTNSPQCIDLGNNVPVKKNKEYIIEYYVNNGGGDWRHDFIIGTKNSATLNRMCYKPFNGNYWYQYSTNALSGNYTYISSSFQNSSLINVNSPAKNISKTLQLDYSSTNPFQYRWWANDTTNKLGTSSWNNYYVYPTTFSDTIPPSGNITTPANNTKLNGNTTIDASVSDNNAVNYVSFQLQNSTDTWFNISSCKEVLSPYDCYWDTYDYSDAGEGYDLRIVPCDLSGNCNNTLRINHYTIDNSVPVLGSKEVIYALNSFGLRKSSAKNGDVLWFKVNVSDMAGTNINNTGLLLDLTDLNGSTNITFNFESGNNQPGLGLFSVWNRSVNILTTTGNKYPEFRVPDNTTPDNNIYYGAFSVVVDNSTSTYNLTEFNETFIAYNNTNQTFTINAFDNLNLSYYIFSTNMTGSWVNDSAVNFTSPLDSYGSASKTTRTGNHSYRFYLFDNAENMNTTIKNNFSVLSYQVQLDVTSILPIDEYNRTLGSVNFTYNYTNGTASACWIFINGTLNSTTNNPTENITLGFNFTLGAGNFTWDITCNNSMNELFSSGIRTLNLIEDTINPDILFDSSTPANGTSTLNSSIEINVSIAELNLANITYNWNTTNFTIYDDSLVLMMNFENLSALGENSTLVADLSKYGNNGTPAGGANYTSSGKYGGAYQFDGVDDYVNILDTDALSPTSITVSAWINMRSIHSHTSSSMILSKDYNEWEISAIGTDYCPMGGLAVYIGGTGSSHCGAIPINSTNTWYHIIFTYNGSVITTYVNGNFDNSTLNSNGITNQADSLFVGARSPSPSIFFNGIIDEVRIWNRSLSASEISQLYMSNLQKYNSTQWYLYVNQSKNATAGLDDAVYTYIAYADDTAGNSNKTDIRTVTIDTINPNIILSSPTNTTYTTYGTKIIDINYTAQDAGGLSRCWWGNSTGNSSFDATCSNFTQKTFQPGSNKIYVYVNDTAGNMNETNVTFFVDSINPIVTIQYPKNQTYNGNLTAVINYTYIEANPNKCWYSTNGGNTNSSAVNMGVNFTAPSPSVGSNNWTVYCNDTINNFGLNSVTFYYIAPDTTPPTFTNLRNFTHTISTSFSQSITATDASGISGYYLNDSNNFNINRTTGLIKNATALSSLTTFWLNISVNDTLNNLNSGIFYIEIVTATTTTTATESCRYEKLGYYNKKLPWLRQEDCV